MIIKPHALKKGDLIGIVSPSNTVLLENLNYATRTLKRFGFRVKYKEHILTPRVYTIEEDKLRAEDINELFRDPQVKAVIHAKGGYGMIRILPFLDKNTIRSNPKVVLGYSDATVFLSYLLFQCNMVAFHGPMLLGEINTAMSAIKKNSFLNALMVNKPLGVLTHKKISVIKHGKCSGKLVGGCLTSIVHMMGTPYEINTKDTILFIEDVGEYYHHFDEMLYHLKLAGKYDSVKGIVFGEMLRCGTHRGLVERIKETFKEYDIPILFGFPSGHSKTNLTIPLGINVSIDTKIPGIVFNEKALQ
ncbi:MAG: LD-carboxypeptidase [Candidatus Ancaeobacter aquaticus]|nr:LD-carboxypeptidase [Candidatus Ancaeobacter aquaticus]